MDILPLSQTPSSNNGIDTPTCKIGSRVSYKTQISLRPFNNFEQAVYYISNTTNTPSPYDLYHYKNTQNNTNNSNNNISSDILFNYLSHCLPKTSFVHYSTDDQLSIPSDINSNIALKTLSLPIEPETYSICQYMNHLFNIEESIILSQHNYIPDNIQPIICDTVQGQLLKCKSMINDQYVAIKRIDKQLFSEKITKISDNGFNFCVEKNIVNEAKILKYLTLDNKCTDYITKYIDFFESDTDYYLVLEYVNGQTLKQFVQKAHDYISNNKLDIKHYQKIIKYIFWQISAILHWMHSDMKCCHMDLTLDNVMLKNSDFTENDDGSVIINGAISVKLCDFGRAEIFNLYTNNFNCVKLGSILGEIQYQSPNILNEQVYHANKADNWALGMMLFECIFGQPLYNKIENENEMIEGNGYWAAMKNKLNTYILVNNLKGFVNGKLLQLLNGLLNVNQNKRLNSFEIVKNKYFKSYYKRYKDKLEKTAISQKKKDRKS
eukprot:348074_1